MADSIVYRWPTEDDFIQVDQIIGNSFGLIRYIDDRDQAETAQHAYVLEPRRQSGFQCVAVEDGAVIGVIMASANNDPPAPLEMDDDPYAEKMRALYEDGNIQNIMRAMEEYNAFIKSRAGGFDGSLTLFAVTGASRGKGVGKTLLEKARAYWNAHGAKRIYLYTDETCNTGFYDHLGFERLDARRVQMPMDGKPGQLEMYLYGYDV